MRSPVVAELLTHVTALLSQDDPERTHAEFVRLVSGSLGGRDVALCWRHGDLGGSVYWAGPAAAPEHPTRRSCLGALAAAPPIAGPRTIPLTEIGPGMIARESLVISEENYGSLILIENPTSPATEDDLRLLGTFATLLARRHDTWRRLLRTRREKDQIQRWFGTMDTQIRVLDRERQKFVAVVGQSDTSMLVVDPQGRVTWGNVALTRSYAERDPAARLIGEPVERVCAALRLESVGAGTDSCPFRAAFAGGKVVHREAKQSGLDGQIRDLYVTVIPIQGTDGNVAEALAMIQDLSDLQVVRQSEARYRALFERSPDAMMIVSPDDGQILLANDVALRLTGRSRLDLLTMSLEELHVPAVWPESKVEYERALGSEHPLMSETELVRADGSRVYAQVSAVRFEQNDRHVLLVEIRDVTERKLLERELRHSQKMEAIGRLAGGVAHDFNNLLTVILGQSELLCRRLGDDDTCLSLETIQKAAVRGSLLTRQLLAFSRKDVVRTELLDARLVANDMQSLLANLIGESIRFVTRVSTEPGFVRMDRGHLEQILMNLCVNARDAMPDGGDLLVSIDTADCDGNPCVEVRVTDTGCGMDESTAVHVFEPFFTTKPPGEGTGLGLSTVYGIVREAGGSIDVESHVGKGTTFVVRLPRESAASLPVAAPTAEPEPVDETGMERILLVEDEDDLREMAIEALELGGYDVTAATNGEDALRVFEEEGTSFELLLTDVIMPGMSGGELAEKIMRARPAVKVLYMSGYNDDAIVKHGVSVSRADFLQKPFTLSTLSRKVREVLDRTAAS
ncbi:MAG: PAS domain S-box protein [bacterium]